MHLTPRSTLVAAAAILGLGCGEGSAPADDADAPPLTITEDLRIDAIEHDLVPIGWLGASPRGEIAFVQQQDHSVVFFTAAGKPAGRIGREGSGPGEFRSLTTGGWIGDTLWISDPSLSRLTLIPPGAQVLTTIPIPPVTSRSAADGSPITSTSYVHGMYDRDTLLVTTPGDVGDTIEVGTPVLRMLGDGTVLGNVARYTLEDDRLMVRVEVENGWQFGQIPFAFDSDWSVSPDGRRVAVLTIDYDSPDGPSYRLLVTDETGRAHVDRELALSPVPIPRAVRDSAINAVASRKPPIRSELETKLRAATQHYYAEAQEVVLGRDYRIWVGLRRTHSGRPWLLLGTDGVRVGRLVLPGQSFLRAADAEHIWVVERDSLDLESVVRYRIGSGGN